MKNLGIERRRAPRIILNSAYMCVYSQKVQDQVEVKGKICDINHLGVKFVSFKPYHKESIINIGLLQPGNGVSVNTFGRVVRCEQKSSEEYHIAVEFKENYKRQALIEDYIKFMQMREKNY